MNRMVHGSLKRSISAPSKTEILLSKTKTTAKSSFPLLLKSAVRIDAGSVPTEYSDLRLKCSVAIAQQDTDGRRGRLILGRRRAVSVCDRQVEVAVAIKITSYDPDG